MSDSLHRLLKRQLARIYGKALDLGQLSERERQLVDVVSSTYEDSDRERRFYEHTLELNSNELSEKNLTLGRTLRSLADAQRLSRTGSWSVRLADSRLEWSDELCRILELEPADQPSLELARSRVYPDDLPLADTDLATTLAQRTFDGIYRLQLPSGQIRIIHEQREVVVHDGVPVAIHGALQDVTEQKLAEKDLHLYADVFRNSGEAILISDKNNRIIAVNKAFTRITGYALKDLLGKNPHVLSAGETSDEVYASLWSALSTSGYWQGELVDRRKDGSTYPKWISISVSYDEQGRPMNYVASFVDISESKANQQRIHYLAHHDSLTGLLNRFSLEERLQQALHTAARNNDHVALLFVDMDRFKLINDNLGHQAGDELLVEVARRLKSTVRDSDIVARIGGDEFVVVLTALADDLFAVPMARVILHMLAEPYDIFGQEVYSSPSIGIGLYPDDGADVETLMRNADAAMYHAKAQGRNNFQFFTESLNVSANERLKIERELRSAIDGSQFELFYQPQMCTRRTVPIGVEALLRWRHPERGLVAPDKFIPIAEETRLIIPIGDWVLEEACRQHAEWRKQGLRIRVAVNLSAQQLRLAELPDRVAALMAKYDMAAGDLELEVTESVAMEKPEEAIELLNRIRSLGVELAIDDFGTGYSSLAYLKLLPIHTLKLDRTFVRDLESNANDAAICAATLALAHEMDLKVVAEGVETRVQRDFLASHACDFLQGYLYSKPVPATEALQYLQQY